MPRPAQPLPVEDQLLLVVEALLVAARQVEQRLLVAEAQLLEEVSRVEMSTSDTREYKYSSEFSKERLVLDSYSLVRVLIGASTCRILGTTTRTRGASTRLSREYSRVRVLVFIQTV
ncbi:hypothetical protein EDB89DRAFT_2070262 [Lactarius sanguifluus]|nr:hypothetical protein EDB89DRAFT_2070262 [Lactarius sanguifluus]